MVFYLQFGKTGIVLSPEGSHIARCDGNNLIIRECLPCEKEKIGT
jgi:hypothetical protein